MRQAARKGGFLYWYICAIILLHKYFLLCVVGSGDERRRWPRRLSLFGVRPACVVRTVFAAQVAARAPVVQLFCNQISSRVQPAQ